MNPNRICFVTYCESGEGLDNAIRLAGSLRKFGGRYARSHFLLSASESIQKLLNESSQLLDKVAAESLICHHPPEVNELFYAGKPYAAAIAETYLLGKAEVFIWIDADAIVIDEPQELILQEGEDLTYVPVMHNRAGSLWKEPPDKLWVRVYELQHITDKMLFPMITPADQQKIRTYFHCGLLAVRPERRVMEAWADGFELLCSDPLIRQLCRNDEVNRIFLHQHALTGAVLHKIARRSMRELSDAYNYPILFEQQYESRRSFRSLHGAAVVRLVVSLEKIGPRWYERLTGPPHVIDWLTKHARDAEVSGRGAPGEN